AVDARWIQSTRSCRQRYVCDHSCDPGAGHACICQRGYRPAGPEDRSRLIGYGGGSAANGLKGQGRVCLDVDECEDAAVRAECTHRGGVCTNRPGDYQCLCPSGQTCLCESRVLLIHPSSMVFNSTHIRSQWNCQSQLPGAGFFYVKKNNQIYPRLGVYNSTLTGGTPVYV
ncbi:unnamed protein product, partial [Mesocestoides corti]